MASTARILVVDDEPLFRDLLCVHLHDAGYEVDVADDGETALEMLRSLNPDMILLDLMMPGISGLDVLDVVRESRSPHDLPIIVVSAEGGSPAIGEALRRGANDYVTKPFNFSLLATRVATLIDASFRARQALGSELHVLEGQALPSAPTPVGYCTRCESVTENDVERCVRCAKERPEAGWAPLAHSPHPHLGTVLGGSYFVEQFVGAGAAGRVYRLRDLDLHRAFAAKIVNVAADGFDAAESLRSRVVSEVKALARVTNPHVVKIQKVVRVSSDEFALVTDFVNGVTLEALLDDMGRLDPADAIRIAWQVAQGLSEAHDLGMVHRDIKPANVMLEPLPAGDSFARILDFGIVRMMSDTQASDGFYGTPAYCAPEQIREDEHDGRADIYSLGATLFHMVTGRPPYVANPMAVLVQHCTAPIPSLLDYVEPDPILEALAPVLQRMLAKEAEERYESLVDLVGAFDDVLVVGGVMRRRGNRMVAA